MIRNLRRLGVAAFVVAVLILGWRFAGSHAAPVRVDYGFGQTQEMPLWLALVGAFGLGAAGGASAGLYQMVKLRLLVRRYRGATRALEAEVHQLRNLPLVSERERAPRGSAGSVPEFGGAIRTAGRGV